MISFEHWQIYVSVIFYVVSVIVCHSIKFSLVSMRKNKSNLSSVPEKDGSGEYLSRKWVPKKKHEVLRAKYKCLKKLFEIYDASIIAVLPDPCKGEGDSNRGEEVQDDKHKKSKNRHKNNCDTSETQNGNKSIEDEKYSTSVLSSATGDNKTRDSSSESCGFKKDSCEDSTSTMNDSEHFFPSQHPLPSLNKSFGPKLTRFQCFIQKLFGIKMGMECTNCAGNGLAVSDNNISYERRRRRRGLRLRRLRKARRIKSETALTANEPIVLSYALAIQRHYLQDQTPRQCPIMGCRMMFYGIINYNDHLNLCHFTERKFVCHFCHEGFVVDRDRVNHENGHIGISRLRSSAACSPLPSRSPKKAIVTQTESAEKCFPDEKLRKIASFFDHMVYGEASSRKLKAIGCEGSDFQNRVGTVSESVNDSVEGKKISAENSLDRRVGRGKRRSVRCNCCGENFDSRRQLTLHLELEHRIHGKFSKYHSCAGIVNDRRKRLISLITEKGKIQLESTASAIKHIDTVSTTGQIVAPSTAAAPYKWIPG